MSTNEKLPGYGRIAAKVAIMQAYLDGKTIEYKDMFGNWRDAGSSVAGPTFSPEFEYRVKPADPDYIDWSHVEPQLKYMARDDSGEVWLYRDKPVLGHGAFIGQAFSHRADAFASLKVSSVDWKDSVVKRPEGV